MDQKLLKDYARLIVAKGAHVVKGDEIWINAGLDQVSFIEMLVEECYKQGAKEVHVFWSHDKIFRLKYLNENVSTLGKAKPYFVERFKYMAKKLPTMIHIVSDDPDAFKGVNQGKVAKANAKRYPRIKKYRDAMDGKYKWVIAAVPSIAWAKKVFPTLEENEAVEKLWEAILSTSRVDGNDPVKNWDEHNAFLIKQREKLAKLNLNKLIYHSDNGTDFEVGLIKGMLWGGGVEVSPIKGEFNPNIPSEEVFTTPMKGKAEGTLVASKPLSYNGELIEDFSITFKDGKVVEVKARKGQKLLEHMISMDEGAKMLGECALVPYDSPIRESGILFYETLFDENAACHMALGAGFPDCYPGGVEMSPEERKAIGINDSMIHVDFMIGTRDLSVIGVDEEGNRIQIFKDGNWAI